MTLVFHERVGLDGRRISPFSWRIRYALAHKGLEPDIVPTRFADVGRIRDLMGERLGPHFIRDRELPKPGVPVPASFFTVPVLVHDDVVLGDSWLIATHLEEKFPDAPSLFGGASGRALARWVNHWSDTVLNPVMRRLIAADFIWVIDPEDRAYYRKSREEQFGCTLEAYCTDRTKWLVVLAETCVPLEKTLWEQPWLSGQAPGYADYVVFSVFQWARIGCPEDVMPPSRALHDWRERLVNMYNRMGDQFPRYPLNRTGPDGR